MILILAFFMHFLFFYSVLDLHFRGLDYDSAGIKCNKTMKPLAKRFVFFIADGLSADQLYTVTAMTANKSFIRSVMEEKGSWGVSKTFVPSLSKPGFLAMVTGTKFDATQFWSHLHISEMKVENIFKYVNKVFYIGDYYIPRYLNKKDYELWYIDNWTSEYYKASVHNFSKLDDYVRESVPKLFKNATVIKDLKKDNIIFIIYMDSTDFCGHNFKPNSKYCQTNLGYVDKNIEFMYKHFMDFYKDNKTAFLLSSDHGMTNAGGHGGGSQLATESPVVTWGAGFKRGGGFNSSKSSEVWNVKNLPRIDIKQYDIPAIISYVLGNPFPAHSYGMIQRSMLDINNDQAADALYCNQKQIYQLLLAQSKSVGDSRILSYINDKEGNITMLINQMQRNFSLVNKSLGLDMAERLIKVHKEQLNLYKNYFNFMILNLMVLIFVGWGVLLVQHILGACDENEIVEGNSVEIFWNKLKKRSTPNYLNFRGALILLFDLSVFLSCLLLCGFVYWKNWPLHFSIYFVINILLWWRVIKNIKVFKKLFINWRNLLPLELCIILTGLATKGIADSLTKTSTRQWFFMLIALSQSVGMVSFKIEIKWQCLWLVSSGLVAIVCRYEVWYWDISNTLIEIGGYTWLFFIILYLYYRKCTVKDAGWVFIYLIMTAISIWIVLIIHDDKPGVDVYPLTVLSWILICSGPILPIISSVQGFQRLCHLSFSVAQTYILTSLRHEAAGFLALCTNVIIWFCLELKMNNINFSEPPGAGPPIKYSTANKMRHGFFLLLFIWYGFITVGNIPYPETYNVKWTKCLYQTFQMVEMTSLIIYKMVLPTLFLSCTFDMLYKCLRIKKYKMILCFLLVSDIASLIFFLRTKGENNSFRCIGISLTCHVLSNAFPMIILFIFPLIDRYNQLNVNINVKQIQEQFNACILKIKFLKAPNK